MRSFRKWLRGNKSWVTEAQAQTQLSNPLHGDLQARLLLLQKTFSQTPDLIVREFRIGNSKREAALAYLDSLVDKNALNNNLLQPLMHQHGEMQDVLSAVPISQVEVTSSWTLVEERVLRGQVLLFVSDQAHAYLFDAKDWPQRNVQDPQLETSLKGAHQGFVETDTQNIAMIRRYLPHRELKIRETWVGARGTLRVSILYLADVVNQAALCELVDRLNRVDVDAVLNSGELEEFIEDNPYSPFPQFVITERPDAVTSQLLQGRIAIILDLSPGVLIAPANFISFFQTVDDYSIRWMAASFIRLMRIVAFFLAILLPSLYITIVTFHSEVIPVELLLSIGESRANIPFPPFLEAVMMEISLEMLREAGVRLPSPIGQTIGVVGAIVIGQAAVQAGIVSNIMVIVVSITGIASFIIPNYDMSSAVRLIRFPMMLISSLFGFVGLVVGVLFLFIHLLSLQSLKMPYMAPIAPTFWSDWKDTIVRLPLIKMNKRPRSTGPAQADRQGVQDSKEGDPS